MIVFLLGMVAGAALLAAWLIWRLQRVKNWYD
jgi:hypothetical protein